MHTKVTSENPIISPACVARGITPTTGNSIGHGKIKAELDTADLEE